MGIFKKVVRFFVSTTEGHMILGAVSFGGGLLLGEYLSNKDLKRDKKIFERGIHVGMDLKSRNVNPDNIEILVEERTGKSGILNKRYLRVIEHNELKIDDVKCENPDISNENDEISDSNVE